MNYEIAKVYKVNKIKSDEVGVKSKIRVNIIKLLVVYI